MPKIDVYLRSIERFGAAGAVLTSGQSITLKFPTGDRHATQVTPHDQLVVLVREVAPPAMLDQIDKHRPAQFEIDSNGIRYALNVAPRPGSWQVTIDAPTAAAAPIPVAAPPPTPNRAPPRTATAPSGAVDGTDAAGRGRASAGDDMVIERGQYDGGTAPVATSGSALLDQLLAAARAQRATDVYLATGAPPSLRVAGQLVAAGDRGPLDAETLSRELGIVAPAEARAAWTERGSATFAYGDGVGRVRATLVRDHRGPGAALRVLAAEPPALDRLGLTAAAPWLDASGLVLIAGGPGTGKTTALAAIVRALGERHRRAVVLEDWIEILHPASPYISQRTIGDHAATFTAGVATALGEGVDAIAIGSIATSDAAAAALDAALAGQLVVATIVATGGYAVARFVDLLPVGRQELARSALGALLLGTISATADGAHRSFEVAATH